MENPYENAQPELFQFETGLVCLKSGERVQYQEWAEKNIWLQMVEPPEEDKETTYGYIAVFHDGKEVSPWLPSQADMQTNTWKVVQPQPC